MYFFDREGNTRLPSHRINGDKGLAMKMNIAALRDYLLDPVQSVEMAKSFANYAADEAEKEGLDAELAKLYRYFATSVADKNMRLVQKHAESEIEKLFLGALVLHFLRFDPFCGHFHEPFPDGIKSVNLFRENHRRRIEGKQAYEKKSGDGSVEGYLEYLRSHATELGWGNEELEGISANFQVYDNFHIDKAFHFVPQARFPDIKVDGKGIRLDLFVFVPADPKLMVAVECDGYQYHSSQERFQNDRRRDRVLKTQGIDVTRFSGSEIFNEPGAASMELFERLKTLCPLREQALEEDGVTKRDRTL
jgi:very-short-patch-repair endonuclease